ncbi:hypothetical protein, partial [Rhodovulum sulfidophilum]|uniref:hypothetical protein n=1 Tax=Rhodovulum sulfidophilum TaxID=35806 RepID=UPI001F329B9F
YLITLFRINSRKTIDEPDLLQGQRPRALRLAELTPEETAGDMARAATDALNSPLILIGSASPRGAPAWG